MKHLAIALLFGLFASAAIAQPVTVIGPVTPGNVPQFNSNTVLKDSGISASGIDGNVLNTQTANYAIATTDCGKTIQAGTGSTGLFTVTLPSVSGFAATCKTTVTNGDTGREKILSGFPAAVLPTLWPGQTVQVEIINGAWVAILNPGKWRPSSPIVFNVTTTGADAAGCAFGTGAAACATGQYAMTMLCQNVDPSQLNPATFPSITIQYATGAYTQNITSFCDPQPFPWTGSSQSGWMKVSGNTNLTSVTLACGSNPCFAPVHSIAGWWVEGFSITGTSGSVSADAGSYIYLGTNKFGTTGGGGFDVTAAYGSLVEFEASFTLTGSKSFFASATQAGSRVIFKAVTVTFSGSTYTSFYDANTGGMISAVGSNVTYSGTATVGASACVVAGTAGGIDTGNALAALATACGTGNFIVNPGWAQ